MPCPSSTDHADGTVVRYGWDQFTEIAKSCLSYGMNYPAPQLLMECTSQFIFVKVRLLSAPGAGSVKEELRFTSGGQARRWRGCQAQVARRASGADVWCSRPGEVEGDSYSRIYFRQIHENPAFGFKQVKQI